MHVMVRHKVADFEQWKVVYDEHAPARAKAGLKEVNLLRNMDNPEEIVLLFTAADLGLAKCFIASNDLRDAMQRAGVIGKPEVYFLQ